MKTNKEILYDYALSFLGLPYKWGGDDPIEGYDCSGFVQELLSSVGLDPKYDQTAQALYDHFYNDGIYSGSSFGALVFYGSGIKKISHVAFALSETLMIEAGGGGSSTHNKDDAAQANAYIRIRPIDSRKDLIGFFMPKYSWL